MNVNKEMTQARPPNFISALLAGFDSISNHLGLLLIPVVLDLILWIGPRLRISDLFIQAISRINLLSLNQASVPNGSFVGNIEFWEAASERINLFSALRSFPVGIPSLLASELPQQAPIPFFGFQIDSWVAAIIIWIGLGLIGLIFGTLYFLVTAQAALDGSISLRTVMSLWPWSFSQVFLLTLSWIMFVLLLSIPFGFLLSFVLSLGNSFGQLLLLVVGGFLLWIIFPLLFSAHGIFVYRLRFLLSIRKSIRIIQLTLPTTALFFLALIIIDFGLGLLWQIPSENSWFMLIGIFGHAFVATALLAASFIYYRDADHWLQSVLKKINT